MKEKKEISNINFPELSNMFVDIGNEGKSDVERRRLHLEDCVIFVFTRDNVNRLKTTLHQLIDVPIDVILLDDSTTNETEIFFKTNFIDGNIRYHGREEQLKILEHIKFPGIERFISYLGAPEWNLGNCRNYALILGRVLGFKKALMIDDDILVDNKNTLLKTFDLLTNFDVVGAKTNGMPDDSVIGHLFRQIGIEQYDFISGQYFGFNVDSISYPFPNIYNEDWILFLLESKRLSLARVSAATQLIYDPLQDIESKCLFQEPGEVIIEGVIKAMLEENSDLLVEFEFWSKVLEYRLNTLKKIEFELCSSSNYESLKETFSELKNYHSKVSPEFFKSFFDKYFNSVDYWKEIQLYLRDNKIKYKKIPMIERC